MENVKATIDDQAGAGNVIAPGGRGGVGWVVRASREARHCINPIRLCEEDVFTEALKQRDHDKELIKLSIGESPTYCKCSVCLVIHLEGVWMWNSWSLPGWSSHGFFIEW